MVVSKRIKAFLRKYQPNKHWHIDELRAYDTYGCLINWVKTTPNVFFGAILNNCESVSSNYKINCCNNSKNLIKWYASILKK